MSNRTMAEQAAATWIAKRDLGPWSERDAVALTDWLEASVEHRVAYYRLNSAWQEAGRLNARLSPSSGEDVARSSHAALGAGEPDAAPLAANVPTDSKPSQRLRYLAMAATVLVMIGAALILTSSDLFRGRVHSTVVGGLQVVPASDGSQITLNTDSAIRLAFTRSERRVELKHGEAFFEVAKDPRRPFVVVVDNRRVVAVGTAFSVRRRDDGMRVVVAEGEVRVELPDEQTTRMQSLTAGSVLNASNDDVTVQTRTTAEIEQGLSWRSGILTFRETRLEDAVAEFNRYNDRKLVIEDPKLAEIQIGGVFGTTNLDSFVQLLEDGFSVRATRGDERIVLSSH
jgi:transmembrane sensor